MWFLSRPDASRVWKNDAIRSRYKRYRGILDGTKKARYLLAKKIAVKESLDQPLTTLWQLHKKYANKFQSMLQQLDDEELALKTLTIPSNSFLDLKEKIANEMLKSCHFCERRCQVNRQNGERGFCRLTAESIVCSAFLHMGEESVLVPSGTIFFSGCTFTCVFCQNYDISQNWCSDSGESILEGIKASPKKISLLAERLWKEGAKNINFVGGDPTPNLHAIISSLKFFEKNITLLWNSNMYQSKEATRLLLDLMDFWLPDFKFWENDFAKKMSGIANYQEIVTRNIRLAYEEGSGEILIRHLLMPGRVEIDTYKILEWVAKVVPMAAVNLMDQYHPDYLVRKHPSRYSGINRRITSQEWQKAVNKANELGVIWEPVS